MSYVQGTRRDDFCCSNGPVFLISLVSFTGRGPGPARQPKASFERSDGLKMFRLCLDGLSFALT